jgi:hypothetical protein
MPEGIPIRTTMRPLAICSGCDRPAFGEQGVTVSISGRLEDYCTECADSLDRLMSAILRRD